ncbi:MAG: DUF547 domain-containing protein [Verrucomicrobia bacterium]|nr:DUF547 domain-containing protein [Verrucomicrobiota bacterium]
MTRQTFLTALAAFSFIAAPAIAQDGGFDHTHAAFTAVLRSQVKNEKVNYAALKASPDALGGYLASLASVKEVAFNGWGKNQRLTFLINLYNAATLKLVVDHYPVKSIKDIGGFLKGPWSQPVVHVFGQTVTLDHIEHDLIRARYDEPRAHFALVCGSIGCPPLRSEAYDAARLNTQLDDQGRTFLATNSKNRVDAKGGVLYLSPIFKWFTKDFTSKSGSVEKFIAPYFNEADKAAILSGRLRIEYTEYDWSLNKQ